MRLKAIAKLALDRSEQRVALREGTFRLASKVTPVIAVELDGVRYFLDTADRDLGRSMFVHGSYERPLMERAMAALTRLRGAGLEGRAFIDVGANIGTATLTAICHFGARGGLALEPHPGNFQLLQHNLLANGLLDQVTTLQAAASDRETDLDLEVFASHHGSHRVRNGTAHTLLSERPDTVQVHATTLDAAIEAAGVDLENVGLAWIDTEGHEGHVLAGAKRLIEAGVPVLIEFWPAALRSAGGLDQLAALVAGNYTHLMDLKDGNAPTRPASAIHVLAQEYDAQAFPWTDLLLLKL